MSAWRTPAWAWAWVLAGCASTPPVTELMTRPAERALAAGIRAYDDAQYALAERELNAALAAGIAHAKDRAGAHKLLAFIYCTTRRIGDCETAFRAARRADPSFTLNRAEAGHPQWGPVYRRIAEDARR